ncbi:hypothetical protein KAW44_00040 [Candidatus Bipolaricaulota bacterium]|nr:hypothetical protein [Candidatus Bipolaricaulota bacterium]
MMGESAGSVVTKDIAVDIFAAGNPARPLRQRLNVPESDGSRLGLWYAQLHRDSRCAGAWRLTLHRTETGVRLAGSQSRILSLLIPIRLRRDMPRT